MYSFIRPSKIRKVEDKKSKLWGVFCRSPLYATISSALSEPLLQCRDAGSYAKRIKNISFYSKIHNDLFGFKNDFITFATSNSQLRHDEKL
ncbi:hypothetical protein B5G10_06580 [Barnesiella sp. An55]|nr:hypothetical protein B5G10_06580 [Barnesiella sp. An55]